MKVFVLGENELTEEMKKTIGRIEKRTKGKKTFGLVDEQIYVWTDTKYAGEKTAAVNLRKAVRRAASANADMQSRKYPDGSFEIILPKYKVGYLIPAEAVGGKDRLTYEEACRFRKELQERCREAEIPAVCMPE